jgi:hypothetical protein
MVSPRFSDRVARTSPFARPLGIRPHLSARKCALFALLCFGGAATLTPGASPTAQAAPAALFLKHQRQVSYPFDQVWPTAVRYLRVERGYEIADRDKDSGYIVFTFEHGSNSANGSVEFLSDLDDQGRTSVTMISSTSRGPSHLPFAILDGIAIKLREERGQPAPPPSTPAEPPPSEEQPDEDKTHDGGSSLPG